MFLKKSEISNIMNQNETQSSNMKAEWSEEAWFVEKMGHS
jgi:hypothetical protein